MEVEEDPSFIERETYEKCFYHLKQSLFCQETEGFHLCSFYLFCDILMAVELKRTSINIRFKYFNI